ncbi:MAG: hypothetical protein QXG00_08210 [Candidatus Woesearchaeota archaeon]
MGIINFLKEDLESPNMMMGRSNIWFDRARGGYEVYFKVNGITYSFLAESEGTEYEDGIWKIQLRKKWEGNTEMVEDTPEVQNAFIEAMTDWVALKNPTAFWWISSEKYPSYNNIAKALSKKLKEYQFIDETTIDESVYDVEEKAPEILYKRFIFTKVPIKETFTDPKEWYEKKLDNNEKTFDVYKNPEDIKPNPEHTTPFPKTGKLDKGVNYTDKKLESSSLEKYMDKLLKENTLDGSFVNKEHLVKELGEQPLKGPPSPLEIVEKTIRANKTKSITDITQLVVDALTNYFNLVAKTEKPEI